MSINYAGCLLVAFAARVDGQCVQVDRLSGTTIMINIYKEFDSTIRPIYIILYTDDMKIRKDETMYRKNVLK